MEGRRTGKSHTARIYVKVTSEFDYGAPVHYMGGRAHFCH